MKKKLFTLGILLSLSFFFPTKGNADIVGDLQIQIENAQAERSRLFEEQKKIQAEIDKTYSQGQSLKSTISELESSKKKLDHDLKITQSNINAANLTVQKVSLTMVEKEKQIGIHRVALGNLIHKLSENETDSLLAKLLTYKSISDIWQDTESIKDIQNNLNAEIDALRASRTELEKQKAEREAQKERLSGFKSELSGQKSAISTTQGAKAKLLAQTQSQEAVYKKLLADNIARQKEFEAALYAYESQIRMTIDKTKLPDENPNVLVWPLSNISISQRFGVTADSGRLYSSGSHNGVDFRAPTGTALKSVASGVIEGLGNTDSQRGCYSYGRWVLIRHNNGLSSMYAHMSSTIVTAGQSVTTGQVIGYSGGAPGANGSGYSTGPHLHLGLFASEGVKIAPYSSSINCKGVSIPLADPRAYLDALAYLPAI